MRVYLGVINPAVAIIVLLLCFWAATSGEKESFDVRGIVFGGMNSYFFAKGLFSASAIFILGRILLEILARRGDGTHSESRRSEVLYCAGLIGLTLSLLTGLHLHRVHSRTADCLAQEITEKSPREIELIEQYAIHESQPVRIGGRFKNNSVLLRWESVTVTARVFIDDMFATSCEDTVYRVVPGAEHGFTAVCREFAFSGARQAMRYDLSVVAKRKPR